MSTAVLDVPAVPRVARSRLEALQRLDPRWYQIAFLGSFLFLGVRLEVVPWWEAPVVLATTLLTQALLFRLLGIPSAGYLSPTITALGLTLLLRSDLVLVPALAGAAAMASKVFLRVRGKHLFNPANFGLTLALALTSHAWTSPSQWREQSLLLTWFVLLGLAVTVRSFRSDVSLAFLASWLLLKAGRVFYLGQRPEVLGHQLLNGGLIVFAFFMISDPKTTPDQRAGRVLFAAAVAALAFVLQHGFWIQPALFWALCALSPLTPLFDRLLPAPRFQWNPKEPPCESPTA